MSLSFGQDRDGMRRYYCRAWARFRAGRPLEPLESQLIAVIRVHPEYQGLLDDETAACAWEAEAVGGETNPFLHMSMHLALHEQVGTDRPQGIKALYESLAARAGDVHALEHRMMECLGRALWDAQRGAAPPDERAYLECLRRLAG